MRLPLYLTAALLAVVIVGCGTDPDPSSDSPETVSLTAVPAIDHWSSVNGVMVPIGATDGPTTSSWEPFTGFSHTPQGAALAAIDQSVQLATASDQAWPKILSGVAASGEGRDTYAVNRALLSSSGNVDPSVVPSILGYLITDYSDTRAVVDVVQRFPDQSLARTVTTVVWIGDDWRLDLPTAETATAAIALTEPPADIVDLEGTRR